MSTRWRYYNNRGGRNFSRGRGKSNKLIAIAFVPKVNQNGDNNQEEYQNRRVAMNPEEYQDETVLCFSYMQGRLGAAIYEQSSQLSRVMNDISEDGDFEYLKRIIEVVKPTIILVNGSQDLGMINLLISRYGNEANEIVASERSSENVQRWDPSLSTSQENEDTTNQEESDDEFERDENVKFVKLSNNFFRFNTAMTRLNELLNCDDESTSAEDRQLIVKMRFDTESVNMIKAVGALLHYLDDTRLGVETEPLNVRTPVKSIKTFVLENQVEIDFNTFRALDILPRENLSKRFQNQKSSVFALLNRCRSSVGKKCLMKWCLNPTTNREILKHRHRCIQFFMQDCNLDYTRKIWKLMNSVKGLGHIFKRFQSGTDQLMHWDGFMQTVSALHAILEVLLLTPLKEELIEEEMSLKDISEMIIVVRSIIDFEDSENESRVSVCGGVDENLDDYKQLYKTLPATLTRIAEHEGNRLGIESNRKCSCIYIPLIGYLLSLPFDFPISEHVEMQLVYKTETEIRVKNEMTEKLEEEIGDIRMQIIDKETSIIYRLKKNILKKRRKLENYLKLAAKIDALISLAMVSAEMGWNCPTLVEEHILEATGLYHPLAALITKKEFVPNHVISGTGGTKISIITGPNACGKSVYMKQVGLLAFLTHIGCFVPARHARVGPIDRIMTRMFTVDSVLDGMSTFAKDVDQVAVALRKGTGKSLVIIDEFGKGTMIEVGLSLLASCLTHWIQKAPDNCPHLFVSSHFHSLPRYIPIANNIVKFLTFRVDRQAGGRIDYYFRLIEGIVDCSFAMSIAKEEGIPVEVVGRACDIYRILKSGKPLSTAELRDENYEDDQMEEYADRVLESSNMMEEIDKILISDLTVQHKKQSRRTLADDNVIGDTQGVDVKQWDITQNLIQEDDEVVGESQESVNAEKEKESEVPKNSTTEKWVESLAGNDRSILKQPGVGRKASAVNQNLSVSFAIPYETNITKEIGNAAFLDDLLPPPTTPQSENKSENKTQTKRPATPPSPILFGSDSEDEEMVHKRDAKFETPSKLIPIMRRLSSNEKGESKSSVPSSSGSKNVIFSTPKLDAARKKFKIDADGKSIHGSSDPFKTPTLRVSSMASSVSSRKKEYEIEKSSSRDRSFVEEETKIEESKSLQRSFFGRTDSQKFMFTPEIQSSRGDVNEFQQFMFDIQRSGQPSTSRTPARDSSRASLVRHFEPTQQNIGIPQTPRKPVDNSQKFLFDTQRCTHLAQTPNRSSSRASVLKHFEPSQKDGLIQTPRRAAEDSQHFMFDSQRSTHPVRTPMTNSSGLQHFEPSQQFMKSSQKVGDTQRSFIDSMHQNSMVRNVDNSQVSPLFSSQEYEVYRKNARSLSPSSVILSNLAAKPDSFMRTPSPTPMFDIVSGSEQREVDNASILGNYDIFGNDEKEEMFRISGNGSQSSLDAFFEENPLVIDTQSRNSTRSEKRAISRSSHGSTGSKKRSF